jgi:hypothetical protein
MCLYFLHCSSGFDTIRKSRHHENASHACAFLEGGHWTGNPSVRRQGDLEVARHCESNERLGEVCALRDGAQNLQSCYPVQ